nr:hypothetical protein Iba_chr07aCG5500 [Ipomoea batatas]GMD14399.1 hypothetical protein Iba_chr07bCG6020 [Ipomoea batatas]GMD16082.1 hypothetical protein Iba_chr07cCG5960 [Ipomoea batatas]GMD19172.1 hypothetical protein Iba_chr07eCG5710 [Ipomoea batatas]
MMKLKHLYMQQLLWKCSLLGLLDLPFTPQFQFQGEVQDQEKKRVVIQGQVSTLFQAELRAQIPPSAQGHHLTFHSPQPKTTN